MAFRGTSISEITERIKNSVDEAANATALTNLSRVMTWAGKQDEALELEPENADACNNLGTMLAQEGDLEGAMGLFEQAVEANPSHLSAM